jgi:hypothetical protein
MTDQGWQRLREQLLGIGGEEVAAPAPDSLVRPFLRILPERGREYLGLVLLRPGSSPASSAVVRPRRGASASAWTAGPGSSTPGVWTTAR